MTESNIKKIITSIQENIKGIRNDDEDNRWIRTKKYWDRFTNSEILANEIITDIEDELNIDLNLAEISKSKTNITVVKNNSRIWFWREEEALERLICLYNENLSNQEPLRENSEGKELADIVEKKFGKIITLIELKSWNNTQDSPLYAIIELLKNYYLYKDRTNIRQLILLAPTEYFKYFNAVNNLQLQNLLKALNNKLKNYNCNICLKTINISFADWEKNIYGAIPKYLKFKPVNRKSNCYKEIASIDLIKYKDIFNVYCKELRIWEEICN